MGCAFNSHKSVQDAQFVDVTFGVVCQVAVVLGLCSLCAEGGCSLATVCLELFA